MNPNPCSLLEAPFAKSLRIAEIGADSDVVLVLRQLGIATELQVEKIHQAPLGDPITVRVGTHQFALRRDLCRLIHVEVV